VCDGVRKVQLPTRDYVDEGGEGGGGGGGGGGKSCRVVKPSKRNFGSTAFVDAMVSKVSRDLSSSRNAY